MRKITFLLLLITFVLGINIFISSAADPYARRIRPFNAVPISCAENEIGYSMTLHKIYICTNGGYQEIGLAGGEAPANATFITQTPNATLTNEQALSTLATGIVKNTTTTGILSIAVAGTDYQVPITTGDVTTSGATSTIGALKVTNGMLAGSIAYSKLTLTNSIVSGDIVSLVWSKITSTPTTIAGYGITDFNSLGDARWSLLGHTHTFASLTSIPTTFAGYGISDTSANLATAISDELGSGKLIFSSGTLNILSGKTLTVNNSLILAGTDSTTMTFPTTSASVARTDAGQTFSGTQTFSDLVSGTIRGGTGDIFLLNSTGGLVMGNSLLVKWSSGANTGSATDTSISRNAAGIVQIGTTAANDLGILDATGFRIANAATLGNVLRGNGTNFVSAQLNFSDLAGSTTVSQNPVLDGSESYSTANQTIADSTQVALTFNTEDYDDGTIHSTVSNTSRFTATTAGKYICTCSVAYATNAIGIRLLYVRLNGTTFFAPQMLLGTTLASPQLTTSITLKLAVNDYVECTTVQTSGGNLDTSAANHYPSGSVQMISK